MTVQSNLKNASRELIRAARGRRSQVAFSRRLGYRSNVAAEWESGRRAPTAVEWIRACGLGGLHVTEAVSAFHPRTAHLWMDSDIVPWLRGMKGAMRITDLADRTPYNRHQLGRWLSGRTQIKLTEFLVLIEVMTGRVTDLVAAIVPINSVPSLEERHRTARMTARLAFDQPFSAPLVALIDTAAYRALEQAGHSWLAEHVGCTLEEVRRCIESLLQADILQPTRQGYKTVGSLVADINSEPERAQRLKAFWAQVAAERVEHPDHTDEFGFNIYSVSAEGYAQIRALQTSTFRQIRSIVAASEGSEVVAMVGQYNRCFLGPETT